MSKVVEVTWRDVECPKCLARKGKPCPVPGNPHIERLQEAARVWTVANKGRVLALHAPPAYAAASLSV